MVLSLRELKHVFDVDEDRPILCMVCNKEIQVGDDIRVSIRHDICEYRSVKVTE